MRRFAHGDVLEMDEESARVTDKVHTGAILVDGLGVGDVGNIVLRVLVVIAIIAITVFRPKLQELWDAIAEGINGL